MSKKLCSRAFSRWLLPSCERSNLLMGFFFSRMLDKVPRGPMFISFCFLVRAMDAISFAAAITASFSILAKAFPTNIATVLVSSERSVTAEYQQPKIKSRKYVVSYAGLFEIIM